MSREGAKVTEVYEGGGVKKAGRCKLRWRGSGDTAKHPAHNSIAVAVGNGTRGSGQCPSWLASTRRLLMDGPFVKKRLRTHLVVA